MNCPECHCEQTSVMETRTREDGAKRRRYKCAAGHRFTTFESLVGHTSTLNNYLSTGARRQMIVAYLGTVKEPVRMNAIQDEIKRLTNRRPGRDTIAHDLTALEDDGSIRRSTKSGFHGYYFSLSLNPKPKAHHASLPTSDR